MTFHRSNDFKDLSWLIGESLEYLGGIALDRFPDGKVEIIADYSKTVLLQLEYIKSEWFAVTPPRMIKILVPKSAIACGDVRLKRICNGEYLFADVISELVTNCEI